MTDYFFDSSALVKRYVDEIGSNWVQEIALNAGRYEIIVAEIGIAEVAAAFAARYRAQPPPNQFQPERSLRRFLADCAEQYSVLETNREMIDLAVRLTQRHRLRGYDAVQLASALIATELLIAAGRQRPTLVSADRDLIVAALSEGLSTENPLDHG